MQIKLLKLGHAAQEFHNISPGATVSSILDEADCTVSGYQVSLNGLGCAIDAQVNDGDIVTLTPKIEGGQ